MGNARRRDWIISWGHLQSHNSVCLSHLVISWSFVGEERGGPTWQESGSLVISLPILGKCIFCIVISVWKLIYSNCKWQRKLVSRQDLKWKRKDLVQSFLQGRSCWVKVPCWERKEFPAGPVFSPSWQLYCRYGASLAVSHLRGTSDPSPL